MLTIFTNPRPFTGHFDRIQRNAILSWKKLCPDCQIILADDEEGTARKFAEEIGAECLNPERNEFGTPKMANIFSQVKAMAKFPIFGQINADIILTKSFFDFVQRLASFDGKQFFASGRRIDFDFEKVIDFNDPEWEQKITQEANSSGSLHGPSGMDYWLFPKDFQLSFPDFTAGRVGMDSWLVYQCRKSGIPVVDATKDVHILHQNHNYPAKKNNYFKIETEKNIKLAGGEAKLFTLREADWIPKNRKIIKKNFPENIPAKLAFFEPWRKLIILKRKIKKILAG